MPIEELTLDTPFFRVLEIMRDANGPGIHFMPVGDQEDALVVVAIGAGAVHTLAMLTGAVLEDE
jgi:hypothetical protein